MATVIWRGDAKAVAQVNSYEFGGTWSAGHIVRVTVGNKSYDFVAASGTIATLIDALIVAWLAMDSDAYPEFAEITPSRSTTTLLLTAAVPGQPFAATLTPLDADGAPASEGQEIEGAGTATPGTAVTASAGPNHADDVTNYSSGALPNDGDTLILDEGTASMLYGLDALDGFDGTWEIRANYDGSIGLPSHNGRYYEYRKTDLDLGAVTMHIGQGDGTGSRRMRLNLAGTASTVNVWRTGTPEDPDVPALCLRGNGNNHVVNVMRGFVGLAALAGQTLTVATLRLGSVNSRDTDAVVMGGAGLTLTNLEKYGGSLSLRNGVATGFIHNGGETIIEGGGIASPQIIGGTVYWNSTGTLGGNAVVAAPGRLDFARDPRPKTVSNPIELYGPLGLVNDPNQVVSNLRLDVNYGDGDVPSLGVNYRLTRGAPS